MIPITARVIITHAICRDAFGNRPKLNLSKPYVPIFKSTPAKITEPAVGASLWASGSQEFNGHKGTLMQNAKANARNSQNSVPGEIVIKQPRNVSVRTLSSKDPSPVAL